MARWVLSIDFGTTTTAAAMSRAGTRAEPVDIDGFPRMPSTVLATESGDLVVGAAAEAQLAVAPERAERTPKRRLGGGVMLLGGRQVRPVEAVAAVLAAIGAEAIRHQGGVAPSELRLTHPARWGSVRRQALAEAASLAGLPDPVFVPEPVAAAVHFADERIVPGAFVVVYDLGGGTFDTAVLRRGAEGFEVVGVPGGDERLGGEVFDEKLFAHIGDHLADLNPEAWEQLRFSSERSWRKAGHDLRVEVRRAKEALSSNAEYTIYLGAPVDATVVVTRTELEALIRRDVEATVDELEMTVTRAGLTTDDLAAVNLVGGSSRIPLVTRLVGERFGQLPQTWGDPKAAVALGAVKATHLTSITSGPSSDRPSSDGPSTSERNRPLPESVGGCRVVAELGRGGMGVVYLGQQPSLSRPVAVKTIPVLNESLTHRLEREAAVVAELQHPHVATVIDVGADERGTFVVMPFFPGGTVAHLLTRDGRIAPEVAAGILAAVAEALAATHSRGFLHRDVKPSNILLSADGDCYLGDFGLAVSMLDSSRLTSSRAVLGTVPYTAPEILSDDTPTERSDAYSLGITGYQLLTGRLPYAGSNVLAVLDAVRAGAPDAVTELAPDCPRDLASLVEQAFAADPTDRPADLREWAEAVRATVVIRPPVPAPPEAWAAAVAATSVLSSDPDSSPGDDAGGTATPIDDNVDAVPVAAASGGGKGGAGRSGGGIFSGWLGGSGRSPRERRWLFVAIATVMMLLATSVAAALTFGGDDEFALVGAIGDTTDVAEAKLKALGLVVEITEADPAPEAESREPGTVVRTDPPAGAMVKKGDTIRLFVVPEPDPQPETEPERRPVPEVVGFTEKAAVAALREAGFRVRLATVVSKKPAGTVVRQRPDAGDRAEPGSQVFIDIAKAPPPPPPPSRCTDGLDNDADSRIDEADPDCQRGGPGDEVNDDRPAPRDDCADGRDNDRDGLIDGKDPECQQGGSGDEKRDNSPPPDDCADGGDNDDDGLIDAADPDCGPGGSKNEVNDNSPEATRTRHYDALLERIPGALRSTCEPSATLENKDGWLAEAKCRDNGNNVYYMQFDDKTSAHAYFDGVAPGIEYGNAGSEWGCNSENWYFEGNWHASGAKRGVIRCYVEGQTAKVLWVHDELSVVGFAARPKAEWRQLETAWRTRLGPCGTGQTSGGCSS